MAKDSLFSKIKINSSKYTILEERRWCTGDFDFYELTYSYLENSISPEENPQKKPEKMLKIPNI